jgi:hypothetical protein
MKGLICTGLFASGSTWTFNLIRRMFQDTQIVSEYFDSDIPLTWLSARANDGRLALIKTHKPSDFLLGAAFVGCPVVLTIRDPRDAVASLISRFSYHPKDATREVARSASRLLSLKMVSTPLVLRYEDKYFVDVNTPIHIARVLDIEMTTEKASALLNDLSADAISRFIAAKVADGTLKGADAKNEFDAETHWHPRHIGDQKVGKYREVLTKSEIRVVMGKTQAFMREFGYPVAGAA